MSPFIHQVVVFSHRKRYLSKTPCKEDCPKNLAFNINHEKSSSTAVYEYFLKTLRERTSLAGDDVSLVDYEDKGLIEMVIK